MNTRFEHLPGISLANYDNRCDMAFDLKSTKEASKGFIHPELINWVILVEHKIDTNLGNNVVLSFLGKRASTVYVHPNRKFTKNTLLT